MWRHLTGSAVGYADQLIECGWFMQCVAKVIKLCGTRIYNSLRSEKETRRDEHFVLVKNQRYTNSLAGEEAEVHLFSSMFSFNLWTNKNKKGRMSLSIDADVTKLLLMITFYSI